MTIACTFPGKFGDLLWALPTVRAISRTFDEPVNLIVSQMLHPILPLLEQQPYIQTAVALPIWQVQDTAPITPRTPPTEFNFGKIIHLGYDSWPLEPLPYETLKIACRQTPLITDFWSLNEPWITVPPGPVTDPSIVTGFTDEYFELKFGIYRLLRNRGMQPLAIFPKGSRWEQEGDVFDDDYVWGWYAMNWVDAARAIKQAKVFLGCCSALHVLSVAMGQVTIVLEPNEHRYHPIFWPLGMDGHVQLVRGNDDKGTFDARHTWDLVRRFL